RLAEYIQHGYVAAPRTGMTSIQVVPPGSCLRARLVGERIEYDVERYWRLPEGDLGMRSADDFRAAFDETLRDAVRIRLRSDVPLGAFLSGGIDSSVVSLIAAEELPHPLKTFTVDFAEGDFSEGPYAAEVAAHLGTEH